MGASLSFSGIQIPSWLDLIEATGELKGTPSNADVGDHDVVISVSDGLENVSQTFTVTVANTNDIPFISGTAAAVPLINGISLVLATVTVNV